MPATSPENLARPPCQLYLEVEARPGTACINGLRTALDAAPIASVLIRPPQPSGDAIDQPDNESGARLADLYRPLVALAQERNVAALILDDIALVKSLKADGVHISQSPDNSERVLAARELLRMDYIVGATSMALRDDAMVLGERGADYIGFGLNRSKSDRRYALAEQLQRLDWWSEIFELPCIAFDLANHEEAHAAAQAGADFIAIALPDNVPAAEIAGQVRAFADAIGTTSSNEGAAS